MNPRAWRRLRPVLLGLALLAAVALLVAWLERKDIAAGYAGRELARKGVRASYQVTRLGFGTAAPGVWIAPGTAYDETLATLDRAGLTAYTELFRGAYLGSGPADVRVGEWWDLPAIAELYDDFVAEHVSLTRLSSPDPARAFAAYVPMLTAWRRLPPPC